MKRGFYTILSAQFLSSLADNALLIAAIALLTSLNAPDWMTPLLWPHCAADTLMSRMK